MELTYTSGHDAFRAEARAWLESNVPAKPLASFDTKAGFEAHCAWEAKLNAAGWAMVPWPKEYGGRGADLLEWLVFEEEYYRAGAPGRVNQNGIFLLGPTIMEFGTPEQRTRFLPKMAASEEVWCQGWSEPNAGSDMAAVRATAIRDGDHYVLNGQKTWASRGAFADWMFGLFRSDPETGARLEPIEEVQVDVDEEYAGVVVEALSERRAEMTGMQPSGGGKVRVSFLGPSRGLIGYHGEFLTATRGTGVMHRIFSGYAPYKGPIQSRRSGVLIANGKGAAVAYALWNLEDRGTMFIAPGATVYQGMIIGEHSRGNDLVVNPLKGKQLTNMRAAGKDEAVRLTTPRTLTLEQALAYIAEDELVEVTPGSIRLRKALLDPHERKKQDRLKDAG